MEDDWLAHMCPGGESRGIEQSHVGTHRFTSLVVREVLVIRVAVGTARATAGSKGNSGPQLPVWEV